MKQVMKTCAASAMGLVFAIFAPIAATAAETEVLQSSVPGIAVGTKLQDSAQVKIPQGATLRILVVSTGTTKTLHGPYEGAIGAYEDKKSWWDRFMGKGKDEDAPVGATRGLRQQ